MTCREFVDFLTDFLEGALPTAQRIAFEGHMGDCPDCVTYLDTYRETVRLGREVLCAGDEAIPAEIPEALVEAILAARRSGDQPPEK